MMKDKSVDSCVSDTGVTGGDSPRVRNSSGLMCRGDL